jgi:hypothetical protein
VIGAVVVAVTDFLWSLATILLRGLTSAFFSTLAGADVAVAVVGSAANAVEATNNANRVAMVFILISFKVDFELTQVDNNYSWHQEYFHNDNHKVQTDDKCRNVQHICQDCLA